METALKKAQTNICGVRLLTGRVGHIFIRRKKIGHIFTMVKKGCGESKDKDRDTQS
ncbi:MAG: hypothetical protein QXQ70_08090 [Candidatus Caldarchaeum sp.]